MSKYLVRFDDICPTMNWAAWDQVEAILFRAAVKPILAVIPENRDRSLMIDPACEQFWERARQWQSWGWTIGLHGYTHEYVGQDPGILGRNRFTEFAGLPPEQQEWRLRRAVGKFRDEGVHPDLWIAPGHSFDAHTLAALRGLDVHVISDGYFVFPNLDASGALWIPQQLGSFRRRPFGVWTVCCHHNSWNGQQIARLQRDLDRYRDRVTSVAEVIERYGTRRRNWVDSGFARLWPLRVRAGARMRAWLVPAEPLV